MGVSSTRDTADRYLRLLEQSLSGLLRPSSRVAFEPAIDSEEAALWLELRRRIGEVELSRIVPFDVERREVGGDWPQDAETMIGLRRLRNLRDCFETIVTDGVEGDLLEAGVWQGGAAIYMKALLDVYGDRFRRVWIADSFRGLPPPELGGALEDVGDEHWLHPALAIGLADVLDNFARYDLLDHRLRVIEGWFEETLASAPVEQLALLRADGDMYSSTMSILTALEPKVSVGGFVVIDDYGAVPGCRKAVDDYRSENGIVDDMVEIDWTGVFWRKSAAETTDDPEQPTEPGR
jgi:O-methyltransferase